MSTSAPARAENDLLSIPRLVRVSADATPDGPALLAPGREPLTYRELLVQIERVGALLADAGIGRRDRVALVLPNGPEMASAFLGVVSTAICAPLNPDYRHAELDFALGDLSAKALIVASESDSPAREIAKRRQLPVLELVIRPEGPAGSFDDLAAGGSSVDAEPDDVALVLHTSGTTSRPKQVPLTHHNLCLSARNVAAALGLRSDDRCLNVMPLFHIHGLVGALLSSLAAGASTICAPGFRAPSFFEWVSELEPTWYTAVPTMHQSVLARAGESTDAIARSRLRFVRSSSAPLPPQVQHALEQALGVPVIESYGMTEAAHQMASNPLPPGERKPGSVGVAAGPEITVLGQDGQELPVGSVGEVAIRGASVFSGYENAPEANAAAFTNGWFRTGDEGLLDDEGYLFLRGRIKEIINRGGEKIGPLEIEDALLSHPDVLEAVAFSIPDERLGEEVGAAIVPRGSRKPTTRELQQFAATRLADFKVPRTVVVVDEIPKGATGKLQRIGLAERLGLTGREPPQEVTFAPPRTALEEGLADIWGTVLGIPSVGIDDDFFALGGDSILGAEALARVGERYATDLPLSTLLWAPTVAALAHVLEGEKWDRDALLVPVQTGGSLPPLYVTHALGSEVFNVSVLKETLGADQPLYAVRARLDRFDYTSVEELAADYVDEIRSLQPSGPYSFASVRSGVSIVIEMARRVLTLGEAVGVVAVIDPLPAHRPMARSTVKPAPGGSQVSDDFARSAARIRDGYRLERLPATLSVLSTMDYETPRGYWAPFAARLDWYDLPAPHATIFHHPQAELLGEALSTALDRSRAEREGGGQLSA